MLPAGYNLNRVLMREALHPPPPIYNASTTQLLSPPSTTNIMLGETLIRMCVVESKTYPWPGMTLCRIKLCAGITVLDNRRLGRGPAALVATSDRPGCLTPKCKVLYALSAYMGCEHALICSSIPILSPFYFYAIPLCLLFEFAGFLIHYL